MRLNFIADMQEIDGVVRTALDEAGGRFLARIGGSDTDLITAYLPLREKIKADIEEIKVLDARIHLLKRYNGFYDKADDIHKVVRFCDLMLDCYSQVSTAFLCNSNFLSRYIPDSINPSFHEDTSANGQSMDEFMSYIARDVPKDVLAYSYIEQLTAGDHTLFRRFGEQLVGKKVLVISPFSDSIKLNFPRRSRFFKNYAYPDYQLLTYNTPITYLGLPDELYPDEDWFATLERMKAEISGLDFDIAMLSCGSYAMPLGIHIRDMGKKAIYVGGVQQLYFGIGGRRYQGAHIMSLIDPTAFISPVEGDKFLRHVHIDETTHPEAFAAYF